MPRVYDTPESFVKKMDRIFQMSHARSASSRPYLGIGLGLLAVSTASLLIRYAQAEGVPSLVIAAYRLALASLVLAPYALTRYGSELRGLQRRQWALVLTSGIFLGAHFAAWITSLAYTSVASSVVLVSASPLFVALMATVLLHEKLSRWVLAGLLLTLAGAVAVGVADACAPPGCPSWQTLLQGSAFGGDLLAVLGALAFAVYLIAGRALRASVSLTTYIFATYATAAVVLGVVVGLARLPVAGYPGPAYLWLTLLGLVPQLVGHSSFNWALKYLPATFVSIAALGEPAGSIVLAALLLHEVPGVVELGGSLLILAGILLASRPARAVHEPRPH
jgi:drug/metabolite transporter (DMT)-like permease